MTKAFGSKGVGPGDASGIVVVNDGGARHDDVVEVEFFKDVVEMLDVFDAFVGGVDFGFGGATGGDGLAARRPVNGAVNP